MGHHNDRESGSSGTLFSLPIWEGMTMYLLLFVLVPLAIGVAWVLLHHRKWRHRPHGHSADMQSRARAARQSADERAARWM